MEGGRGNLRKKVRKKIIIKLVVTNMSLGLH